MPSARDAAHFVLEELAQGLDQAELHALRQAAHVVVDLDDRSPVAHADAFDHSGRASLNQVFRVSMRLACSSNTSMKTRPMICASFRGQGRPPALQKRSRASTGIDSGGSSSESCVHASNHLRSQQAGVHEDADQPIAELRDGKARQHRGVDAAAQAADHAVGRADLDRNRVYASSTNEPGVQLGSSFETSKRKAFKSSMPRGVCRPRVETGFAKIFFLGLAIRGEWA